MGWREWLAMTFSERPGEPSIRRQAFALALVLGFVICFLGLRFPLSKEVETITIAVVGIAGTVMGAGRFAEFLENRKDAE